MKSTKKNQQIQPKPKALTQGKERTRRESGRQKKKKKKERVDFSPLSSFLLSKKPLPHKQIRDWRRIRQPPKKNSLESSFLQSSTSLWPLDLDLTAIVADHL
ncbi:hypothetical protein SLEP1_g28191 [Rubroshorea leprosula]|uniref:Uncharacterized protein n=1 Tax=Rubroshorea leprosula TaxID=152421 RepID=A0AAV5JSV5_9ROSI|nr:hypothetical protein SLEP1_g28191 [Rubroshorea leprosula]